MDRFSFNLNQGIALPADSFFFQRIFSCFIQKEGKLVGGHYIIP